VVIRTTAKVTTPEFQKLWSNLIEFLRLKYENTIQHPDADAAMVSVRGVLTAIARLAGCTPASVGESLIVHNMADTKRNLKGKQLYSALYGVYTEVLHDLTAILKDSAAKGETARTTITASLSIEEFREQSRRKRKPTDNADKRAKKPTASTTAISDPDCIRSLKFSHRISSPH
jgi:hypothetical protein